MEIIEGTKRFSKLYIDKNGFCYIINRNKGQGQLILRCHQRECQGSGIYDQKVNNFHKLANHSHQPKLDKVKKLKFLQHLKFRAESETLPLKTLYEEEVNKNPGLCIPPFKKLYSTLHKRRRISQLPFSPIKSVRSENTTKNNDNSQQIDLDDGLKNIFTIFDNSLNSNTPSSGISIFVENEFENNQAEAQNRTQSESENNLHSICIYEQMDNKLFDEKKNTCKIFVDEIEGYTYVDDKSKEAKEYSLRCYEKSCHATGVYNTKTCEIYQIEPHDHLPDIRKKWKDDVSKSSTENDSINEQLISGDEITISEDIRLCVEAVGEEMEEVFEAKVVVNEGMELIEGQKRHSTVYVDKINYCYRINRKISKQKLILKCHDIACKGSGIYNPILNVFNSLAKHIHYPDHNLVTKLRFLKRVKDRTEKETTPIKDIYIHERMLLNIHSIDAVLPPLKKIESALVKRRKISLLQKRYSELPPMTKTTATEIQGKLKGHEEQILDYTIASPHPNICKLRSKSNYKTNLQSSSLDKCVSKPQTKPSTYTSKMMVIEGLRRFSKLFVDEESHSYVVNRKCAGNRTLLRCCESKCISTGVFNTKDNVFKRHSEHSHRPNKENVLLCKFMHTVKFRAETESTPLQQIYEEEKQGYSLFHPPPYKTMASTLYKRRKNTLLQEPDSFGAAVKMLSSSQIGVGPYGGIYRNVLKVEEEEVHKGGIERVEIDIVEESNVVSREENIVSGKNSVLVCSSPTDLQKELNQGCVIHLQELTKGINKYFCSLLMLSVVVNKHVFPVVYALLTSCTTQVYVSILKFMQHAFPAFSPLQFIITSNRLMQQAIGQQFPSAEITICYMNYTQTVLEKVEEQDLTLAISNCSHLQHVQYQHLQQIVHMLLTLPFLPANQLLVAISDLNDHICCIQLDAVYRKKLQAVVEFVKEKWIEDIEMQLVHVCVQDCALLHDLQALNKCIMRRFGVDSHSFNKLIGKFVQFDFKIYSEYKSLQEGNSIRNDKSKKCLNDVKVLLKEKELLLSGKKTVLGYLDSISHCIPKFYHSPKVKHLNHHQQLQYSQVKNPLSPSPLPYCEISVVAPEVLQMKPVAGNEGQTEMCVNSIAVVENQHNVVYLFPNEGTCERS